VIILNRYLALSRTSHGILDIAAPAFVALLWLGGFPPLPIMGLSLFTAFAAYTSVYALNDLVGMKYDREKFAGAGINAGYSVEASADRYPLARRVLSARSAGIWIAAWFGLALIGSYLLNPVVVVILLAAAALEVLYCHLLKVTFWRVVVSGLVKTSGPIAAVYVVDHAPAFTSLLLVFGWFFFWEIGGQNIPADWNDTEEDRQVQAMTIPVQFGFTTAGRVVLGALMASVGLSAFLPQIAPARLGWPFAGSTLLLGYLLLLRPGYRLYRQMGGRLAARLFDSASYYPLSMLGLITVVLIARNLRLG
jgi:4-hydroxybenzoate polyprenyltransferase